LRDLITTECSSTRRMHSISAEETKKAAEAILKHCPELARIFYSLYGRDTKVWLRADHDWTTLLAEEGFIQGCVFGPFEFGFASKEAYDHNNNAFT
jgi:hypothetical protein